MTKREIDIMNLAFYMSQATDSLKNAEQLFTGVFPNGLACVDLRIAEIKNYVEQATKAIHNELEAQDRAEHLHKTR